MIKELLMYVGIGFLSLLAVSLVIVTFAIPLLCLANKHYLWAGISSTPVFLVACGIIGYTYTHPGYTYTTERIERDVALFTRALKEQP